MTTYTITNQTIKRGSGYGQYLISGTVNGVEVKAHTTDSEAFDWFKDDSNEEMHNEAIAHVNMKLELAYDRN